MDSTWLIAGIEAEQSSCPFEILLSVCLQTGESLLRK
jgi:hypothetical protein